MESRELAGGFASEDLAQPIFVGNYELFRILGEGGLATTYLGRDLGRGQLVAVKALQILKTRNRGHIELFEREAEALQGLRHEQIPQVFETLVSEGPESLTLYLVQEFVPGRSLDQMLRGGAFSAGKTVAVMLSCLEPLRYLHGLKPPLYHRDIKPSNVIVRSDGRCVLIDFGAVREALADPRSAGSSVVGTFGYMAPEQFQGRLGPGTDLYSLGATALHLVTGRHPSDFGIKRLKPDFHHLLSVDSHLAAILDLLLEPAAEDRYQSVASLQRALERWVGDHREEYERERATLSTVPDTTPPSPVDRERPAGRPVEAVSSSVTRTPIIFVQDRDALQQATAAADSPNSAVTPRETAIVEDRDTPNEPADPARDEPTPPSTPVVRARRPDELEPRERADERRLAEAGASPANLNVPIKRHLDRWLSLFNPAAKGYVQVGGVFIALGFLLAAVSRVDASLVPALPIAAAVVAVYGATYFLFGWLRRRSERTGHFIETADGKLLGVSLNYTLLGGRYVVLDYGFTVEGRPFRGRRVFDSRERALPFLRNDLTGMVWYDEQNPRRNTLEHA